MYYYFISAMFIPFQVIMLPLVVQANAFHLDNIYGITFLYIIFGLPMTLSFIQVRSRRYRKHWMKQQ